MTPEKLLSYDLPLFKGVTIDDLAGITLDVTAQSLEASQTLFDQDDASYDIYFLLSGSLLAVFWTDQGREIVFTRFPDGSYFGELAAFDSTPRSLAIMAKSDAQVLTMKRDTFMQLFHTVPLVRERVALDLVARVRSLTARNLEMVTLSVEQRVAAYLLRLATSEGKLAKGAIIDNAPTHAEIAGSIGANREMVSRSMSKLAKQGLIKSARQKIEILDPVALSDGLS